MPKLKQATISSLKGVVVVEEFLRYKNVLDNPDESDDYKLNALKHLKEKKPAKEIIKSTGIGTTLKTLENHPNKDIVEEVKSLCNLWELTSDAKHQPTVEVRYDNLTLHIRRTSVKFFLKELGGEEIIAYLPTALVFPEQLCKYVTTPDTPHNMIFSPKIANIGIEHQNIREKCMRKKMFYPAGKKTIHCHMGLKEEDEKLADVIEKEIFHTCKRLISKSYRKTVRKITFVLRHEKAENEALKQGMISPSKFVKKYLRTA